MDEIGTENTIEISSLTKRYGSFTALSELDLTVKKGEFMGLLGPNGAGKSTCLKLMTNMINATSGTVYLNGVDVSKDHRTALSKAGCMVEQPEYYPNFTPSELLYHSGRVRGLSDAELKIRARDVLEQVSMWSWKDKTINSFSKGMRQRTALAQALLSNPEILILDEPTSGLDPRGMIEMRAVLNDLKRYDRTVLISTHILKEVSELCSGVTMIRNGRKVVGGNVSELLHNSSMSSKGCITIELKTIKPMNDVFVKDISAIEGVRNALRTGETFMRLEFIGNNEQQSSIVDLVQEHELRLLAMNEKGADLETLYMELTKGSGVDVK